MVLNETMDILKRLSPKNQSYFMTLVRLAEAAENGVKQERIVHAANRNSRCRDRRRV